jgi:hypothetical protein
MHEHSLRGYLDISVYTGGGSSIQGDSAKTFKGKLALPKAKGSFFIGSANSTYLRSLGSLQSTLEAVVAPFLYRHFFLVRFDGNDIIITLSRPLSTALFALANKGTTS